MSPFPPRSPAITPSRSAPRPLTLAVECSRLARDLRGMGQYVRALLPRVAARRPDWRLVAFASRHGDLEPLRAALRPLALPDDRTQVRCFDDLCDGDVDLWWYPWNFSRPAPKRGVVVTTIHDVAPLAYPDPRLTRWLRNRRLWRHYRATAARARVILADSVFTAEEVEQFLGVPMSRIRVAPLAGHEGEVPDSGRDAAALERLGVRLPYVLAVNRKDRRKNLALLHRAMVHVTRQVPATELVMVGTSCVDTGPGAPPWLRSLGFVGHEDLVSLFRNARMVVVPSLHEGFGLPVLEAMRLGTPVVCARAASLPEVAGDAALYVSPLDERELSAAIIRLLGDDALHETMRCAGLARATCFSWDETARLTLAAFDEALSS